MTTAATTTGDGRTDGLVLRGIGKSFVGITVLQDVDLEVRPGEVVAVLGENGAGKSTLSSIIAGIIPPSTGTMTWNGRPYAPGQPKDALHAGIGLIHQEMRLLPQLSIAENVFVGHLLTRNGRIDRAEMNRRTQEQIERLGLHVPATRKVGTLRVAAQQQVEIAKALTWNSRLMILDEPTAALGGEETERLFEQVRKLKADGVSFIYISHRLDEIAQIADRIVVLRDGQLVAQHPTARVPVPTLVENMVGRSVDRMFPEHRPAQERVALEVENLTSADGSFEDVSFKVHAGEIVGIAGIVGAGRTELVRAIAGADPLQSGTIRLEGRVLNIRNPRDAIDAGIVLVPEDRKGQGLVLESSIAENMAIGNLDLVAADGWVLPGKIRRFAVDLIARMGVKGAPAQDARHLSGGNQQKVVIAKWLARSPKVFILDEPTRGIDVGARAMIYDVIVELARAGMAVVVVSSDLDEVLGLSHRVMVLARGRAQGMLGQGQASRHSIMELATA
ncbi:sugar ABC transporter ATP-binding protein [Geminicoccus roseus]|uniref:sugar ABC transporter ATP-binding protein n=1 Tax=Geminicoccus roseus TaxID=404900 RepID=UPI0004121DB8|nr:sugar ABC transporter ATP-binding protein [Geminicoccus roseus]